MHTRSSLRTSFAIAPGFAGVPALNGAQAAETIKVGYSPFYGTAALDDRFVKTLAK